MTMNFTLVMQNATPMSWSEVTRWNYISYQKADPPQIELYTYFTIEQHLITFICIFAIQCILHLVLKIFTNQLVFQKLSWIDCLIHMIYSCFIPCPMEEWDAPKGTTAMHRARKDLVLKEMLASILLNFGFNLLLLTPLIILGLYVT